MTKALVFINPGEIDIRGAYIAGMSAKDDDSAIGYFGTGLKYAIAQVLAQGGSITIWSGLSKHTFHAKDLEFRGQEFSQVMMDSLEAGVLGDSAEGLVTIPLGFTTGYGKRWQPWQIFRELYANALDEGGEVAYYSDLYSPPIAPDRTVIIVEGWEELLEQYFNCDEIILPPDAVYDDETDDLLVSKVPSSYIYYKGVRVASNRSDLRWNFKRGLTLTEDRTVESGSWEIANAVGRFVKRCENEAIIRAILCPSKMSFEANAMGWFNAPKSPKDCSTEFANVAADLYRQDPVKWHEYEELAMAHEPALRAMKRVELTALQTRMLDKAKALVARMGYEYEVTHLPITVEHLGGKTLGKYKDGEIFLSPLVFDQGTKQVVSTLYEECVHAKLGYRDCTYEMQTHLFNTIVGLFEELWGEPC